METSPTLDSTTSCQTELARVGIQRLRISGNWGSDAYQGPGNVTGLDRVTSDEVMDLGDQQNAKTSIKFEFICGECKRQWDDDAEESRFKCYRCIVSQMYGNLSKDKCREAKQHDGLCEDCFACKNTHTRPYDLAKAALQKKWEKCGICDAFELRENMCFCTYSYK